MVNETPPVCKPTQGLVSGTGRHAHYVVPPLIGSFRPGSSFGAGPVARAERLRNLHFARALAQLPAVKTSDFSRKCRGKSQSLATSDPRGAT